MSLFDKKKTTTSRSLNKQELDDIFNSPIVKKDADNTALEIQKDIKGPKGINSKTVEKTMEKLEVELNEREKRKAVKSTFDSISENNMNKAELEFEDTVVQIKDKQSKIRYGRIQDACVDNIDQKLSELNEKYDYLTHKKEKVDYGFNSISDEEFNSVVSSYDIEKKVAERRPVVENIPGLTEEQKAKIREFFEANIKAKPIDFVNSIPELEEKHLDKIKKYLEQLNATVKV